MLTFAIVAGCVILYGTLSTIGNSRDAYTVVTAEGE